MQGKLVSLEDALNGCERILRGEFNQFPESALYMIGSLDEAVLPDLNVTSGAEVEHDAS
jgi:F-type H+-transporting ATPase subunit beta